MIIIWSASQGTITRPCRNKYEMPNASFFILDLSEKVMSDEPQEALRVILFYVG